MIEARLCPTVYLKQLNIAETFATQLNRLSSMTKRVPEEFEVGGCDATRSMAYAGCWSCLLQSLSAVGWGSGFPS